MKRLIGLLLLFGLITLCTFHLPLPTQTDHATQTGIAVVTKQEIQKEKAQRDTIENEYDASIVSLLHENDSLLFCVTYAKDNLKRARNKVNSLQAQIAGILQEENTVADTASKLALCDSLKDEIKSLIVQSQQRDSLCDSTVSILSAQVLNKDSCFKVAKRSFLETKVLLDNSLVREMTLAENLNACSKQVQRQKFKSRLLAGGATFLAGIVTYNFVNRKQ